MEELYNIGIIENSINNMLEMNPELMELNQSEIIEKETILKNIKCSDIQIRNIISSNSIFLSKESSTIKELLNYLYELGFKTLNILFDSNPYILNLEPFEIEEYINKRKNNGEILDEIVDDLDSNPYLFNEI